MKTVREFVQTFMIFLVPLVSLLIHGCAADLEMSPKARNELKEHSTIRVIHYSPLLHLPIREANEIDSDYKITMTDPLSSVKERFLATVQAELGLSNFDVAQDPHPSGNVEYDLEYLKQLFGKGLVLDFGSVSWVLSRYPDWSMVTKIGPRHYGLTYVARARLIRVEDSTVLWHKVCRKNFLLSQWKYTLEEWHANDDALLKVNAEEEARKCADQLAASFLGKPDSR